MKSFLKVKKFSQRWWEIHARHFGTIAFVGGFIIDYLTLTRIDQFFDNFVLIAYLTLVALGIVFVHFYNSKLRNSIAPTGSLREKPFLWVHTFAPIIIPFAVGGIMSGLLVFYSRSATLAGSWPFMLILLGMIAINELLKEGYARFTFQVSMWYFALLLYLLFAIPMLFGAIGVGPFLVSGVASLAIVAGFIRFLKSLSPWQYALSRKGIFRSILGIYVLVNVMYFFNIIPPVPLSLKDTGVYHHVVRSGNEYVAQGEIGEWYDMFLLKDTFHAVAGDRVYVYSAIFAPRGLSARVVHKWSKYDEVKEKWVVTGLIPFSVSGGRDGGFRGYTINNVSSGDWRVDITTESGQIIGRVKFEVKQVASEVETERVILE